ncbi:MAG: peptidylprolyl isomerase, partial [Planctomycetota bacterium]
MRRGRAPFLAWVATIVMLVGIAAQGEESRPFARVNGREIPYSRYEEALLLELGQRVTQQMIYEAIVQAELARRNITVPDELIGARIREIKRQHQERTKGTISFEESLRHNQLLDPAKLQQRIEIEQGAGLMIRKDLGLTDAEIISPEEQQRWYRALKRTVKIATEDPPPGVFVQIQWSDERVHKITRRQVLDEIAGIMSEEDKRAVQLELIRQEAIGQLAEKAGITVDKKDILTRFREMKQEWELIPANQGKSFEEEMAKEGKGLVQMLGDPKMKDEILLRKLVEPTVTEEEVRQFVEENRDLLSGKRIAAAHILVATVDLRTGRPKDEEGAQEAEKKIREIAQKLKAGEETFETLASRASDDLETASRG